MQEKVLDLIRLCLWGRGDCSVDYETHTEMVQHALVSLPASILSKLDIPEDLRSMWQTEIYQQISYNVNYRHEQAALPISVPYVILKGTSTAKYYPNPKLRAMGDIDIMPRREDFGIVCDELLQNGYREITNDIEKGSGRHRQFVKNGIEVEVHAFYAYLIDLQKAKLLDDLIIDHINPSHELPDDINGVVLLDHINHHMESGLGLRQIIDWMMYVNQCLPDEKWQEFQTLVRKTGHETLAKITTRMCEIYLGLPEHQFCSQVDPSVCKQFIDYVLSCGNFGRKQEEGTLVSISFLGSARSLRGAIQFLQGRGIQTWPAAQKYSFLRPFVWIHQGFRYLKKGLQRKDTLTKLKAERMATKQRNELLDALGVSREEKGIVRYRNGKYVKE